MRIESLGVLNRDHYSAVSVHESVLAVNRYGDGKTEMPFWAEAWNHYEKDRCRHGKSVDSIFILGPK